MKTVRLSRRQRRLLSCAPISEERLSERSMRSAVFRARASGDFGNQQRFDRAVATLVRRVPVPPEIEEWFSNENLLPRTKLRWKTAKNPAVLAVVIALAVIAGVSVLQFMEHRHDFPGADAARKLLMVASSTRSVLLDPVRTDAGALGDLFFMKHQLEHYDVPPEFADFRTLGCRVFDDEEGRRVAQIWVIGKGMQFFLFPAERNAKTGSPLSFSGWRYVKQENWTGVVQEKNGVCFMAAVRGREKDLAPYVSRPKD
jgi:hypothetical protein